MVIFASSIGRSGTRYLADLFAHCTDLPAEHAAEPICHGDVMTDVYSGKDRKEVREKARIIEAVVAEHGGYFESTQMFTRILARTFLDVFPEISVIHLLRDPVDVACSYMNRKSYPSHPDRPWRLPLNLDRALFRFPLPLTPFQENLCDWLENELRYLELEARLHKTVEFNVEQLGSAAAVCSLLDELDVPYSNTAVGYHTRNQDLDRNANRRRTRPSRKILRQSAELVEILHEHAFPGSMFRRECYQQFDFLRRIAAVEA